MMLKKGPKSAKAHSTRSEEYKIFNRYARFVQKAFEIIERLSSITVTFPLYVLYKTLVNFISTLMRRGCQLKLKLKFESSLKICPEVIFNAKLECSIFTTNVNLVKNCHTEWIVILSM